MTELLALYKEVQEYFENGFEVPDDVTLLFADDNFGSIRRLPMGSEKDRSGRAGVCNLFNPIPYCHILTCSRSITISNMSENRAVISGSTVILVSVKYSGSNFKYQITY